jgi:hypothetical protein
MWQSSSSGGRGGSLSGYLIAALFAVVAALFFGGIYLLVPGPDHFGALVWIGSLSLVFGLVSYIAQATSRDPTAQRAAAWGFGAFGFAILFITVGVFPYLYPNDNLLSTVAQFFALIVLILLLIAAIAGGAWRFRGRAQDEARAEHRREWASKPAPSAFSYAAAQSPEEPSSPTTPPGTGGS